MVIWWQGPDAMQVIRQQHEGIDAEWSFSHDVAEGFPKYLYRLLITENMSALGGNQGEEIAPARGEESSILHGQSFGLCVIKIIFVGFTLEPLSAFH